MRTIQRLAFVVVATIVCLSASAIDIKLKKDKTVVDGITFAINADTPPILAAWMPNILYLFIAYYCYRQAPN